MTLWVCCWLHLYLFFCFWLYLFYLQFFNLYGGARWSTAVRALSMRAINFKLIFQHWDIFKCFIVVICNAKQWWWWKLLPVYLILDLRVTVLVPTTSTVWQLFHPFVLPFSFHKFSTISSFKTQYQVWLPHLQCNLLYSYLGVSLIEPYETWVNLHRMVLLHVTGNFFPVVLLFLYFENCVWKLWNFLRVWRLDQTGVCLG